MPQDPIVEDPLASPRDQGRFSGLPVSLGPGIQGTFTGSASSLPTNVKVPKAPKPWNDIARSLDSSMPQDMYDDLRFQYFNTYVRPQAPAAQVSAYWKDFEARTQRPKAIESPLVAQAKLAALSAGSRAQELLHTNPTYKKQRDDLLTMMHHDGLPTELSVGVGSAVPDVLAFAGIEAVTGGVGGLLAEGAEAGSIAARAAAVLKGTNLANRMAKGALTFGTFEAVSAQKGTSPGYAFLSGAAQGAAWELGFAGLGKVLGKSSLSSKQVDEIVKDVATPRDTVKEVQQTMAKRPGMNEADQVVAKQVELEAEKTRAAGLPLGIKLDDTSPNAKLMGVDHQGKPFTIPVKPYAESQAMEELKGYLDRGGQLQVVAAHSEYPSDTIRTLSKIKTLTNNDQLKFYVLKDALSKSGTITELPLELRDGFLKQLTSKMEVKDAEKQLAEVETAKQAAKAAPREATEGGAPVPQQERAQWEAPPEAQAPVPEKPRPSMWVDKVPQAQEIMQTLTHMRVNGAPLSPTEMKVAGKRILSLWLKGLSPEAREANAQELRGLGVAHLVPKEYQPTVRMPALTDAERLAREAPQIRPTGPTTPTTAAAAEGMPHKGKWKLPDLAPMFSKSWSNKQIQEETGLTMAKVQSMRSAFEKLRDNIPLELNPRVPMYDLVQAALNKPKARRNLIDIVMDKKSWEALRGDSFGAAMPFERLEDKVMAGFYSEALDMKDFLALPEGERYAGIRMFPEDLPAWEAKESMYHEDLHVQIGLVRGQFGDYFKTLHPMLKGSQALEDIAEGLAKQHGSYRAYPREKILEEGFVHPASAIRVGNLDALKVYAHFDTSIEHVRFMVDEVAASIKGDLEMLPDSQELRGFSTRLDDLMRRTGKDRFSRWTEEAVKQELDFHFDPEAQSFSFKDDRGQGASIKARSSEDALHLVANRFEEHMGFDENVPSSTNQFERMGMRGQIFSRQAVVKGSGDKPTPHFLPKSEDSFRGLKAVTALFQPMLSWAARLDERFAKAGQKTGLFDLVKTVDEGVRNGMQWQEDMYHDAAQFIGSNVEHAKLLTPFMQAQESAWPSMAKKLGVDEAFLARAAQAKKWLQDFQTQTGIQVQRYFQHDLGRLQNFNYSPSAVWPRGLDKSELSRIPRAIVEGELNPRDTHFGHTAAWLIREGFAAKFTEQPLSKLRQLLNSTDADGRAVLGASRFNVANYIDYIRGVPDPTQQVMLKAVGDFQKNLAKAFEGFNKQFGTKLPTEFNYPGDLLQKYMLLSYVGSIGLRPAIWARDAFQAVTNTLPVMGPAKFLKGIAKLFEKGSWEKAMDDGALLGKHNVGALYGDIFQELNLHGGKLDKAIEASGKLLAPSRWAHNLARAVAYHGEYDSALEAVRAFRSNKIDAQSLMQKTSMWFFDAPLQQRLLQQTLAKTSEKGFQYAEEEMAKRIALESVDHTLWAYRRGTQPMFLRTGIGRVFGQYGLWPLSYIDYCRRLVGKLGEHPSRSIQAMGLWAAANQAATSAFSSVGGDVSKWFFISPASYGGSPHLQMAQAVGQALENSQQGREARKTILEYPMNFIPAYLEMKSVAQLIGQGGKFFNDDWSLTPEAVRVMGMHPKSQDLDLTPEEELEYQAGFSHRR